MIGLRLRELEIIFWSRYGGRRLPPDDSGTDDAMMALHHLAGLTIDPRGRMRSWLSTWAPWMPPGEAAGLIERAMREQRRYRADTLARRLNLHLDERTRLGITTIGAVDKPKAQRLADQKEQRRLAQVKRRRARGIKPRASYVGSSTSRAKPWISEGISRATWYRRQRETETSLKPALTTHMQGTDLSHTNNNDLAREIWLSCRMR